MSMVSLYYHVVWLLGNAKECYLRHEYVRDQFLSNFFTGNSACNIYFEIYLYYLNIKPEKEGGFEAYLCNELDRRHICETIWSVVRNMFIYYVYHYGF